MPCFGTPIGAGSESCCSLDPKRPRAAKGGVICWVCNGLREVYAARDAYAAEHRYDLDRIYAHLRRREASSRLRRVKAFRWPGVRRTNLQRKTSISGKTATA